MACPIARSLERVGEWWSILIIRDALHGFTRFDQFQKSLNIAPNMLTRRLNALVDTGVLERRLYSDRPPRYEYILTEKGRDFRPVPHRDDRLGQQALRSRGRQRIARRQKVTEGGGSRAGRSAKRKTAQRARLCVCRRPCRQRAHTPPLRNGRSKETIRPTANLKIGARQKVQGVMITAARRTAVDTEGTGQTRLLQFKPRTRSLSNYMSQDLTLFCCPVPFVLQVRGDAGCAESMVPDPRLDVRAARPPLNHRVGVLLPPKHNPATHRFFENAGCSRLIHIGNFLGQRNITGSSFIACPPS